MKVEDLDVYRKLFKLALEMHRLSLSFPRFELYELGSQLRRSSNSSPANLAEGFDNQHLKMYLQSISRAQAEIRETIHHLRVAFMKKYLNRKGLDDFIERYEECSKMLYGLANSLRDKHAL